MYDKFVSTVLVAVALVCVWLYLGKPQTVDDAVTVITAPKPVIAAQPVSTAVVRVQSNDSAKIRISVPVTLPDCNTVPTTQACQIIATPIVIEQSTPTEVPVIVEELVLFNADVPSTIEATATAEVIAATRAPDFVKPNMAATCVFIGCLPSSNMQQVADYQRDCHAEYWAQEGGLDTPKARTCNATGDYR